MIEIVILVEEDPEGEFVATAVSDSIVTQAGDLDSFRENVRDAVQCHFEDAATGPKVIRLHHSR